MRCFRAACKPTADQAATRRQPLCKLSSLHIRSHTRTPHFSASNQNNRLKVGRPVSGPVDRPPDCTINSATCISAATERSPGQRRASLRQRRTAVAIALKLPIQGQRDTTLHCLPRTFTASRSAFVLWADGGRAMERMNKSGDSFQYKTLVCVWFLHQVPNWRSLGHT